MKEFQNIPNELVTDTKGREHWISPSISTDAIVIVEGRVLVTKRSAEPEVTNPLRWCLPCGYMDWNETPLNACIRELYEETGVDVRELAIMNGDFERPNQLHGHTALQFIFELPTFPKVELNSKECERYRWISLKELPYYDWAFHHDILIEKIMTNRNLLR